MGIAHLSDPQVCDESGIPASADAKTGSELTAGGRGPRVTPLLPFEVEEFHAQIPDEDWRHRLGVHRALDSPCLPV